MTAALTFENFSRRCMQIEAKKRATTTELLAHKFISGVERKTNLASPSAISGPPPGALPAVGKEGHGDTHHSQGSPEQIGRRELSMVVEDDERESGSRLGSRSRGKSRESSHALSKDEDWGNISVDSAVDSEKKKKKGRGVSPPLARGFSPPARHSILDGLPPDPFKGSGGNVYVICDM